MIIIIGGGISGLYCAYRLEQILKKPKILLIEKEEHLGGRLKMIRFLNKKRVCGAGIGRYHKDTLLKKLLIQMKMPIIPKKTNVILFDIFKKKFFKQSIRQIKKILTTLKMNYKKFRSTLDFKNYFLCHYSEDKYNWFKHQIGYTDYEYADIVDTLNDYGFEDVFTDNEIFGIDWDLLINKLKSSLQFTKIITNDPVCCIDTYNRYIITENKNKFKYSDVFIAGTKETFSSLFQNDEIYSHFISQIGIQSFLRLYIQTDKKLPFDNTTYINNSLQKIIPFGNNEYMISYSDNENAEITNRMSLHTIENMFNVKITDYKKCFHLIGTHFYYPLNKRWQTRIDFISDLQQTNKYIHFIGEMISTDQGWTEGALTSVEYILKNFLTPI